ncbi:MAG: riboflavin synthase [Firmicutes bacterium]|nr:riboflavin synthase [Bacillota bacterium]
MFTGLVEEKGLVRSFVKGGPSGFLTIEARRVLEGLEEGDSIAVNGVCLTVTGFDSCAFTVDVMAETLEKTNIGLLAPGAVVNLERALKIGGRLGGHFVTGHVDATGAILSSRPRGIAVELWIKAPPEVESFLVPQGSVALDGVSLTVADLKPGAFMVSLIPHTREKTTLGSKRVGDLLNIEADIMGKYISYLLMRRGIGQSERITPEFLAEHGFI